jgi:hypothetical protein
MDAIKQNNPELEIRIEECRQILLAEELNERTVENELGHQLSLAEIHLHRSEKTEGWIVVQGLGGVFQATPLLKILAPKNFDYQRLISSMSDIITVHNTRNILRYSDYWKDILKEDFIKDILRKTIKHEKEGAIRPLIEYFSKIKEHFSPEFVDEVDTKLSQSNLLPYFMALTPFDELPEKCQAVAKTIIDLEEPLVTDKVVATKRNGNRIGTCDEMTTLHKMALFGAKEQVYRAVLIYVENQLVASMKYNGENSIIGLRNVQDSEGRFPLVIGGIYSMPEYLNKNLVLSSNLKNKSRAVNREILPVRNIETFLGMYQERFTIPEMVSDYGKIFIARRKELQ